MVDNNLYKLNNGDIVISRPNQMHNCILNSNSVHSHLCFWFDPSCEFIFERLLNSNATHVSPTEKEKQRLCVLYNEIISSSEKNDDARTFYLMLEMIDIVCKSSGGDVTTASIPTILKNIVDDINDNLPKINSLNYFTEKYSISSSTLNRMFRDNFNTSPKMYLETRRLAFARILLRNGESVMEACMKAGFPDYSNFIRTFKKAYGSPPKQFRTQFAPK